MATDPNTLLSVYAALAENVYRRDHNLDQALSVEEISALTGITIEKEQAVTDLAITGPDGTGLGNLLADEEFYYSQRGFGGMIVKIGTTYVVVLRGTDSAISGWDAVVSTVLKDDIDPRDIDPTDGYGKTVDLQDTFSNKSLGFGTYEPTQWDDTRALTEKANSGDSVFN